MQIHSNYTADTLDSSLSPNHIGGVCLECLLWMNWPQPQRRIASMACIPSCISHITCSVSVFPFFSFSFFWFCLSFAFSHFQHEIRHFQFSFFALFWPLAFFYLKVAFLTACLCLSPSLSLSIHFDFGVNLHAPNGNREFSFISYHIGKLELAYRALGITESVIRHVIFLCIHCLHFN